MIRTHRFTTKIMGLSQEAQVFAQADGDGVVVRFDTSLYPITLKVSPQVARDIGKLLMETGFEAMSADA